MVSINLQDIVILNVFGVDYRCNINGTSKSKAVNLRQIANLREKVEKLWRVMILKLNNTYFTITKIYF